MPQTSPPELILLKYGELALKGANRYKFEKLLFDRVRAVLEPISRFYIQGEQSTVIVGLTRGLTARSDPDEQRMLIGRAYAALLKVFGIARVVRCRQCDKDIEAIYACIGEYAVPELQAGRYATFRCECRRSDKRYPLGSPEIAALCGEYICNRLPDIRVDLRRPELTVHIEVRADYAYVHTGGERGAGGLPAGSNGRGLALLSGGFDSPVAAYMMARRGMLLHAVYFESPPFTGPQAMEKVRKLGEILSEYTEPVVLHTISLTDIQQAIRVNCAEDCFTLILRRCMVKLAVRLARELGSHCLITGESLGQVASQTAQALIVTEAAADGALPILRPLVGMDKTEIIEHARHIGTFDTSILPYQDCCTVFIPRHPVTKPQLAAILEEEIKIPDLDILLDEAYKAGKIAE